MMNYYNIPKRKFLKGLAAGTFSAGLAIMPNSAFAAKKSTSTLIGFDLWSGVPGAKFGSRINKTVGSTRIIGPKIWKHPYSGQTLTIYVRTKRKKNGVKTQYYALRSDKTALARVFDHRPGQADRYFAGDAFFPLGEWKDGKSVKYNLKVWRNGKVQRYNTTLNVIRRSHKARGISGSLKYGWVSYKAFGGEISHEHYIYSPRVGFVAFKKLL
jgi:hypothetical protein